MNRTTYVVWFMTDENNGHPVFSFMDKNRAYEYADKGNDALLSSLEKTFRSGSIVFDGNTFYVDHNGAHFSVKELYMKDFYKYIKEKGM